MKRKLIPLIALVPIIIAVFTIVMTINSGEFIFLRDGLINEQASIYQTYQSSLAYCEDKFGSGSMKADIEYSECINTVEAWYNEQANPLEKLQNYKSSLEEINQFNQEHLLKLEKDLLNASPDNQDRIKEEIAVLERIIKENTDEIQKTEEKIEDLI